MKKMYSERLRSHQPLQKLAVLVIFGLAVHLLLPQITSLEKSWQVLTKMSLWAVGLAVIAQVISYLGSGYILQQTLAIANQPVTLLRSVLIVLGAASISMVAGGTIGGSAAIYRWTSTEEGDMEGATLASLLPTLFNNVMLVLVSVFGLVHLILAHKLSLAQLIGFGATLVILGLIIGLCLLAVRYQVQAVDIVTRIFRQIARFRHKSFDPGRTQKEMADIFSAWNVLWRGKWQFLALGAFLNTAFDMLTLYFLFIAAGHVISFGVLLSGYGLPLLLGKLAFILPGGVGVVESSMAALYNGFGASSATTVVVVLGYRLISFWIPSIAGFPIAAYLQRSRKRPHPKEDFA